MTAGPQSFREWRPMAAGTAVTSRDTRRTISPECEHLSTPAAQLPTRTARTCRPRSAPCGAPPTPRSQLSRNLGERTSKSRSKRRHTNPFQRLVAECLVVGVFVSKDAGACHGRDMSVPAVLDVPYAGHIVLHTSPACRFQTSTRMSRNRRATQLRTRRSAIHCCQRSLLHSRGGRGDAYSCHDCDDRHKGQFYDAHYILS
jgi:hypothetical protein